MVVVLDEGHFVKTRISTAEQSHLGLIMIARGIGGYQLRSSLRIWVSCICLILFTLFIPQQLRNLCPESRPSINLVLALTKAQDYSWTAKLTVPGLSIVPFIADDPKAKYHPPANKGREALMYLSYIHQFYDSLPDVSIFSHGDDKTWHIDSIFENSTLNAINELQLSEVTHHGYINLRTAWWNACPAWINTTNGYAGSTGNIFFSEALHNLDLGDKVEEPYMKAAFKENFPGHQLPEILAQPCCSQFAVSKAAIRSVPKEQYREKIQWLLKTPLSDQLTGRMWEHMWQFLFLNKPVVCPLEFEALCQGWHICFKSQEDLENWNSLANKRDALKWRLSQSNLNGDIQELRVLEEKLRRLKNIALRRGNEGGNIVENS